MHLRSKLQPTPEHWSKDFVEHLRTVHFALLTVSVGLILLLTQRSHDARKALAEINEILTVKRDALTGHSTPQIDPDLLSDALKKDRPHGVGPFEFAGSAYSFVATPDQAAIQADPTLRNQTVTFHLAEPYGAQCIGIYLDHLNGFPGTVREIQRWWDSLRMHPDPLEVDHVKAVSPAGSISTTSHKTLGRLWITGVRRVSNQGVQLRLGGPCFIRGEDATEPLTIEGSNEKYEFSFTVTVDRSVFDDQILSTGKQPPIPRLFADEFKDLAVAAQGREDEPLETLATQLTDEALKSSEAFEAFGFKFRGEQVTQWGIILLICVQLYLVMYLRQLSGKLKPDDPGWDLPWMAMDQSLLARVMLFVSMVLLPTCAALAMIRQTTREMAEYWTWHVFAVFQSLDPDDRTRLLLMLFGFCVSVTLSILSWRYRPKLSEPVAPAQLFE